MAQMNPPPASSSEKPRSSFPVPWLVIALAVLAWLAFLLLTPDGGLAKADMFGYAVCHRLASHSFTFGGRQLPLCARCTGTFIGALVGLLGQALVLRRTRAGEFPPIPIVALLVLFILIMGADGLNSYLTFFPGAPHLYEPRNWLRLVTGTLNGLAMSALIYPAINATLWYTPLQVRAVGSPKDLAILLLLEGAMVGTVLSGWAPLLIPLAVLSALGVLALLTCVNTVIAVMIVGRENTARNWRQAIVPLLAGMTLSLIEVGAIDALRYALTGTLQGLAALS